MIRLSSVSMVIMLAVRKSLRRRAKYLNVKLNFVCMCVRVLCVCGNFSPRVVMSLTLPRMSVHVVMLASACDVY